MDELLTTEALATALGVEPHQIDRWRKHYAWPHVKIGKAVRFTATQIDEIIERHMVRSGPGPDATYLGEESGLTRLSAARASWRG